MMNNKFMYGDFRVLKMLLSFGNGQSTWDIPSEDMPSAFLLISAARRTALLNLLKASCSSTF